MDVHMVKSSQAYGCRSLICNGHILPLAHLYHPSSRIVPVFLARSLSLSVCVCQTKNKRALGDRTNNASTDPNPNPTASKPGAAIVGTPGVKPAAAAERRAASRALIDGEGAGGEEGPGECSQS